MTKTLLKPENSTLLTGIKWETYQALLLDLAENPGKKLTYDQGTLEIMTPLPEHEINKGFLGRLVQTTTEVLGLEISSLGSTTLSRKDLQKGVEPDECYYITNEELVRGKIKFDLDRDPPPDLAIEIYITSSSLDRLTIYAALGIREIWRFDGEKLFIIFFVGLIPHRLHGVQNYLGLESPCNFPPVSCLLSPVSFFNYCLENWSYQEQ
ncbi:Uma2 family endonuclease [Okeania hirsuta]|uniref:Uma2 family endonuclease n=2 Tax=Okeania TaxID=1458928 RepID=UPI001F00E354|nr:Uma2 family endonuclease [Okeania hirsuta]